MRDSPELKKVTSVVAYDIQGGHMYISFSWESCFYLQTVYTVGEIWLNLLMVEEENVNP